VTASTSPAPGRLRARLDEIFGIDLRTLALFRVALATLLIVYVINRLANVEAFFTDWGVLPRSALLLTDAGARFSLYLINGQLWSAVLLLLATLACAVALWLGYRTRQMTVALFVLVISLVNRNPMITIGGDSLLACLLFWAMFLPLSARWSIDAALAINRPPADNRYVSWATAAILLQVLSVYFFSAILKNAPDWWPDGSAVYYTMQLERYASPLGRYLLDYPRLMQGLSYFVYFLELLGPVLALSPVLQRPLRFVVMLCLMGMHAGFVVFMEIGHFPFVSLTSLTLLLGGWWWDWAARRADHGRSLALYYDRDCGFCRKSCELLREFLVLRRTTIEPAQDHPHAGPLLEAQYSWVVIDDAGVAHTKWQAFVALLRHSLLFRGLAPLAAWKIWRRPGTWTYEWVGRHRGGFGRLTAALLPEREVPFEPGRRLRATAGLFLVLFVAWNLTTVQLLPPKVTLGLAPAFRMLRLDQIWNMFAPYPSRLDGWAVYPGTLEDGSAVDVLRPGRPLSWERPRDLSQVHENIMWHTYRWRILDRPFAQHRANYAKYLCRDWNWKARPGKRLFTFDMVYLQEISLPPGQTPELRRFVAWRHDCRPPKLRAASAAADDDASPAH